jgi:hypothetical protein
MLYPDHDKVELCDLLGEIMTMSGGNWRLVATLEPQNRPPILSQMRVSMGKRCSTRAP